VVEVFFLFLWVSACVRRLALALSFPRVDDSWDIAVLFTGLKIHSLSFFTVVFFRDHQENGGVFIGVRGLSAPRCFHFGPS
jgi:hypothetical protein